ncbi:MAG TPA: Wadjet anti-phage system protein JetD domain-containing protein [Puia sp.]|nr:Wadjet anti-phage system protein JetD domain-containing protein [Puia sp.]
MIDKQFISQLENAYEDHLRRIIRGQAFQPIRLRGGKNKPGTTQALHQVIQSFLAYEKKEGRPGWSITWEPWLSRKLGKQRWPADIILSTEEDLLFILHRQEVMVRFRQQLQTLTSWNDRISGWLEIQPSRVLRYQHDWKNICTVIDVLLHQDCSSFYLRNLPVPVHTKFIETHRSTILSLLHYLQPDRFPIEINELEKALGLRKKPLLFSLRWLDKELALQYTAGFELLALTPDDLKKANWEPLEIWLVENETNLYLLPSRKKALAVCSMGYLLHELKDIPFFSHSTIVYWGDLDEDGFIMLGMIRKYYPHAHSVLMDHETVLRHNNEIEIINYRYSKSIEGLKEKEKLGYHSLLEKKGRIEQEKLQQDYVCNYLAMFEPPPDFC